MILTTLLAAAALFGGPTPVLVPADTSDATAEGIEILRRILADQLDQAFAKDKTKHKLKVGEEGEPSGLFAYRTQERGLVQTLWSREQTVQHSRAFHMPDVGLFLTFDAALPVVTKVTASAQPKDDGKSKDDEWESARRAVRGGDSHPEIVFKGHLAAQAQESEIDPQAIERTIETVIKTIARHAARIEGLAPQETVTVALHLTGRNHGMWNFDETTPGEGEEEGSDEEGSYRRSLTYVLMASDESDEQNLVIRLSLGDLVNYSEGGYERLRQRAQVNRYPGK